MPASHACQLHQSPMDNFLNGTMGSIVTSACSLSSRTVLLCLLKFIMQITLHTHFVACLWYIFSCQASCCHENTWVLTTSLINSTVSDTNHYCSSLYWAMATLTSTGYGNLTARSVSYLKRHVSNPMHSRGALSD